MKMNVQFFTFKIHQVGWIGHRSGTALARMSYVGHQVWTILLIISSTASGPCLVLPDLPNLSMLLLAPSQPPAPATVTNLAARPLSEQQTVCRWCFMHTSDTYSCQKVWKLQHKCVHTFRHPILQTRTPNPTRCITANKQRAVAQKGSTQVVHVY